MINSRQRFEKWWLKKQERLTLEGVSRTQQGRLRERYLEAWQAATVGPDAATVALHFGYEVTKIRDQVFIAKNNACGKVWIPFSRDSHPQLFMEYEKCL